jgi:hypothetical protein
MDNCYAVFERKSLGDWEQHSNWLPLEGARAYKKSIELRCPESYFIIFQRVK